MLGIENQGSPVRLESKSGFKKTGAAAYAVEGTELILSPINDMIDLEPEAAYKNRRQVLFKT